MKEEKKSVETQENILEAARKIFAQKGLAGARMQEIADSAGINKALLHYYYRSKEKLFEQIFEEAFKKLARPLAAFLADDSELFQKIRNICRHYNKILVEYPFLPNFIINEVNTDPSRILKLINVEGIMAGKEKTLTQISQAIKNGKIREIDPRELILNIISLSIFPFASKPIASELLYQNVNFDQVLRTRADKVADFIIQSIKI
ncbi:TetR family transcriptional regulator [Marinifilum sp. N1E240]|uniref:TetR/AcrR family transcriptional regulator n=1 Tax=Marinifilum sp. N1E240 TaxID=2608082 RepID=UPI00128DA66A|nr:TetR/AcrR family transcriptional regulator [Marinifilum sp. N1E240]MPQ47818.1 TetR family transcriptional regulator [Marinifilum sp. N1E240]